MPFLYNEIASNYENEGGGKKYNGNSQRKQISHLVCVGLKGNPKCLR